MTPLTGSMFSGCMMEMADFGLHGDGMLGMKGLLEGLESGGEKKLFLPIREFLLVNSKSMKLLLKVFLLHMSRLLRTPSGKLKFGRNKVAVLGMRFSNQQ